MLSENLIKFLKDFSVGFTQLHSLARIVKIGPSRMITFREHAAYNASAFALLAGLLAISINFFSPANSIGFATSLVSTVLTFFFVGLIGFFVNLAAPQEGLFADGLQDDSGLTNKWASYFALNLVVLVLVFLAINCTAFALSGGEVIAVSALTALRYNYYLSAMIVIFISSIIATSIVFLICKNAGKILDGYWVTARVFLITNIVCSIVFYFVQYGLFGSAP